MVGKKRVERLNVLEVSPFGVGTVLRLARDTWPMPRD